MLKGALHPNFIFSNFFFVVVDVDHFKSLYGIGYSIASVLCFGFLVQGMWDLSSPTRDRTHTSGTGWPGESPPHSDLPPLCQT